MTIPASPLPEFKKLFQVFGAIPSSGHRWAENDRQKFVRLFSRGLWALDRAVHISLGNMGKTKGQIWVPDYFCNEALAPIRRQPHQLIFYPIKDNLEPDWDIIEQKIKRDGHPDIFIIVHYYGFTNDIKKAKEFCDFHGIALIEDAAHVLLPGCGIGQSESITFFSPRKLLAIPEGGILVLPSEINGGLASIKDEGRANIVFRWLVRCMMQRIMVFLRIPWQHLSNIKRNKAPTEKCQVGSSAVPGSHCGILTRKFLSVVEESLGWIILKRRENYNLLYRSLKDFKTVRLLYHSLPEGICPYVFPIIIMGNRDQVLLQLRNHGIPAGIWPDLPPEVLKNEQEHKVAICLQRHIILLPVHQDLSRKQLEYMSTILHRVFKEVPA